jgi:hypothetical protein
VAPETIRLARAGGRGLVTLRGVGGRAAPAAPGFAERLVNPPIAALSCRLVATGRLASAAAPVGLGVLGTTGTRFAAFEWPPGEVVLPELSVLFDVCRRVTTPDVALPGVVVPAGDGPTVPVLEELVPPAAVAAGVFGPWLTGPVGEIRGPAAARIAALVAEMGLAALAS